MVACVWGSYLLAIIYKKKSLTSSFDAGERGYIHLVPCRLIEYVWRARSMELQTSGRGTLLSEGIGSSNVDVPSTMITADIIYRHMLA